MVTTCVLAQPEAVLIRSSVTIRAVTLDAFTLRCATAGCRPVNEKTTSRLRVMVSGSAIATLVLFILSIILVIHPVAIPIPFLSRKRSFPFNLTTAPIIAIAILWAAQCLGPPEVSSCVQHHPWPIADEEMVIEDSTRNSVRFLILKFSSFGCPLPSTPFTGLQKR